jgi:UDP-N-acetylmuramoylalanine--D-glutamate ligase
VRLAELKDKNVAILGLGREGIAARQALHNAFPEQPCTLVNETELENLPELARHELDRIVICSLDQASLDSYDVLILSPGISRYRAEILAAAAAGAKLTTGTQVWFSERPHVFSICVTGTKGKSTTASLIAHLLKAAGKSVQLAGNIGKPLLDCLQADVDYQVMELSSYQLAGLEFSPNIGIFLSFFPEHLGWHGGVERYLADKLNLINSARSAIINGSDPVLMAATEALTGRLLFNTRAGYHADASGIHYREEMLAATADLPLRGVHNAANICAALTVIEQLGLERASAIDALSSFETLPHRLQLLPEKDGIIYVDDSIATTPFAALAALKALPERPVTQLLGGFERGVDWSHYISYVSRNTPNALVCMGQNGPAIYAALQKAGVTPSSGLYLCAQLADAVTQARKVTAAGGLVLLSPGAASFPEFTDFEHRGAVFAELAETGGN